MEKVANNTIDAEHLEWVFFDFDGTLRHNEPQGLNTFHQFVEDQGVVLPESIRRQALRWNHEYWASSQMLKNDVKEAGEERDILYQRYTRRHLQQLGIQGDQLDELAATMYRLMADQYEPVDHVPPEVFSTLIGLRRHGYSLALISNRSQPFDEKVIELGLADHFEFTLAAGVVGSWKPDPELLLLATERAGIDPDRTIYVGDNPYADVAGAKAAGIQPVLIDPDDLFPEIDCIVISKLDQLLPMLTD